MREAMFSKLRDDMIEKQLKTRGINDKGVLDAFRAVKRHEFVPKDIQDVAYEDNPLPIGYGQTISQPYIVALMTQELALKKTDVVLEIGTGSGYQAAILSKLVKEVHTIEYVEQLAERAKKALRKYSNVRVICGDGFFGVPGKNFNAIMITAAAPKIPLKLIEQLKINGRIILPLRSFKGFQDLALLIKTKRGVKKRHICGVVFVPMKGKIEEEEYTNYKKDDFLNFARGICLKQDFASLRAKMVKEQVLDRGIKDNNIINAMLELPREEFVPKKYVDEAYRPKLICFSSFVCMSEPYITALLTKKLDLKDVHTVLEIGTGSGYQTAVLAKIAKEVYTVDILPSISKKAGRMFEKLELRNIFCKVDDGYYGWKEKSPFDRILVTTAVKKMPLKLLSQLKDNGKMLFPLAANEEDDVLTLITKKSNGITTKQIATAKFVPVRGAMEN